jgi:hypothetical protein
MVRMHGFCLIEVWKFEKWIWKENLKEKGKPFSLSLSLSFSFLPPAQIQPASNPGQQAFSFFPHRARRRPKWPNIAARRPSTASLPSLLRAGRWQVGPGRQALPQPPAGSAAPPFAPPAVTGRFPRAPRLQAPYLSSNEASPSLPPLQSTFTPLNPPLP